MRDIPTGLGWLIGPYVTSIPRESRTSMPAATQNAILQRMGAVQAAKESEPYFSG
jgi:hypothetical protein